MAEFKTYTHTVYKNDDLRKYLTEAQIRSEMDISYAVKQGRRADGKLPAPEYYVCNTDEPYAEKVLQVILDGEDEKTRMLSTVEKLNLINSMEVVEDSCSSGELEYVTVDDNETNRDILHRLGLTDEKIKSECCPEHGELDIGIIAFTEAGASYYDFKEKRFR